MDSARQYPSTESREEPEEVEEKEHSVLVENTFSRTNAGSILASSSTELFLGALELLTVVVTAMLLGYLIT